MSNQAIPVDFPRDVSPASAPGAQPKLGVCLFNGKYATGFTEEELLERYGGCEDLAQRFVAYCTRKISKNPVLTQELCLTRARKGFALKVQRSEWDFSEAEQDWVMKQACEMLGW